MFRIVILLLVISTLSWSGERPGVHIDPSVDESHRQLVDFALERFDRAGLELPAALHISFPEDPARCFGYGGVYLPAEIAVRICRPSDTTMVHELAHAWLETTLGAAERSAFMDLRGLTTWTGGAEWDERGAEQAAEVLTWALMDRDITVRWLEPGADNALVETHRLFKIENSSFEELAAAFQLLTGTDAADRSPRSTGEIDRSPDLVDVEARRLGLGT